MQTKYLARSVIYDRLETNLKFFWGSMSGLDRCAAWRMFQSHVSDDDRARKRYCYIAFVTGEWPTITGVDRRSYNLANGSNEAEQVLIKIWGNLVDKIVDHG